MSVSVCARVHPLMYIIFMYVRVLAHATACVRVQMCVHTCMHLSLCLCMCVYTCAYVCVCVSHMLQSMHMCSYVAMR